MNHMINLIIGDWSGDGHDKTEKIAVLSSSPKKELMEAYKKGTEILDVDVINDYCTEYEEGLGTIPFSVYCAFQKLNPEWSELSEEEFDSTGFSGIEHWADMFMTTCKVGNPNLEWKYLEVENVDIGGYGLFIS